MKSSAAHGFCVSVSCATCMENPISSHLSVCRDFSATRSQHKYHASSKAFPVKAFLDGRSTVQFQGLTS